MFGNQKSAEFVTKQQIAKRMGDLKNKDDNLDIETNHHRPELKQKTNSKS